MRSPKKIFLLFLASVVLPLSGITYPAVSTAAPQVGSTITSFQLTSATSGTLPFTVGLAFKQGDIAGVPQLSLSSSQVIVKRRWNDGSVKMAIASGQAPLTSGVPSTINVTSAASAPTGTNLTVANIVAAHPSASVELSGYGTVNLSSLLSGSPVRTWISGPEMIEAHYRSNVGTDPTLSVSFYVRLYKGGKMWVRAVVENGYLDIATVHKTYIPTVIIGGTTIYNNGGVSLSHYAHTRWSQEAWIGSDPQIIPKLNTEYLIATKLVPNYWKKNPTATTLNGLNQNYLPMQGGSWTPSMGATGYQAQIGLLPRWDALYLTSGGDSRAFKSVIANANALNSYAIIWNDSVTQQPVIPSNRPTWTFYGPNQGGGTSYGAGPLSWDVAHHGSGGYLAYLITGDYYYLETLENQAATTYLINSYANGAGTSRLFRGQPRGMAWSLRTVSQLAAIAPQNDVIGVDYQALLSGNIAHWKSVKDTLGGVGIGYLYAYNLAAYDVGSDAPWMEHFIIQTLGMGSDLEPLANMTVFNEVRDWYYRGVVGILGDANGYCFNNAGLYTIKISNGTDTTATTWFKNWKDIEKATLGNVTCGNTLLGTSGGYPGEASTGYWGNMLPAIAYAVEDGAVGASAAWTRLSGASNWSLLEGSGFDDAPMWGIIPRTISIPTPTPTPTPDTIAPSVPTSLASSNITQTSLTLSWTTSTDNVGVMGYKVFKNNVQLATPTTNSLSVTGLTAATQYSFTISANDAAGNNSAKSSTLSVTTLSIPTPTPTPTPIPTPTPTGPALTTAFAHFKLNDNMASRNVFDEIGGHNGLANANTSTLSTSGKINTALSFNGTNQSVDMFPLLNDIRNDTIGTFSMWVKPVNANGSLLSFTGSGGSFSIDWYKGNQSANFSISSAGTPIEMEVKNKNTRPI